MIRDNLDINLLIRTHKFSNNIFQFWAPLRNINRITVKQLILKV